MIRHLRLLIFLAFIPTLCLARDKEPGPAYRYSQQDTSSYFMTIIRLQGLAYNGGLLVAPDINLVGRLGARSNSYFGFCADYAVLHHPTRQIRRKYDRIEQQTWHAGLSFIQKTRSGWHFHATISRLMGWEELSESSFSIWTLTYTHTLEERKVRGFDLTFGSLFAPANSPIAIGLEIFARETNSRAMGSGAGFKASFGFRF